MHNKVPTCLGSCADWKIHVQRRSDVPRARLTPLTAAVTVMTTAPTLAHWLPDASCLPLTPHCPAFPSGQLSPAHSPVGSLPALSRKAEEGQAPLSPKPPPSLQESPLL